MIVMTRKRMKKTRGGQDNDGNDHNNNDNKSDHCDDDDDDDDVFETERHHSRQPRWPSGKASASRAEDPGFESPLTPRFFRGRVIPVTKKIGTPVATLAS